MKRQYNFSPRFFTPALKRAFTAGCCLLALSACQEGMGINKDSLSLTRSAESNTTAYSRESGIIPASATTAAPRLQEINLPRETLQLLPYSGETLPNITVHPVRVENISLLDALKSVASQAGISVYAESQTAAQKKVTVFNLQGALPQVVARLCHAASVYCALEQGSLVIRDTGLYSIQLPTYLANIQIAEGRTLQADIIAQIQKTANTTATYNSVTQIITYTGSARSFFALEQYLEKLRHNLIAVQYDVALLQLTPRMQIIMEELAHSNSLVPWARLKNGAITENVASNVGDLRLENLLQFTNQFANTTILERQQPWLLSGVPFTIGGTNTAPQIALQGMWDGNQLQHSLHAENKTTSLMRQQTTTAPQEAIIITGITTTNGKDALEDKEYVLLAVPQVRFYRATTIPTAPTATAQATPPTATPEEGRLTLNTAAAPVRTGDPRASMQQLRARNESGGNNRSGSATSIDDLLGQTPQGRIVFRGQNTQDAPANIATNTAPAAPARKAAPLPALGLDALEAELNQAVLDEGAPLLPVTTDTLTLATNTNDSAYIPTTGRGQIRRLNNSIPVNAEAANTLAGNKEDMAETTQKTTSLAERLRSLQQQQEVRLIPNPPNAVNKPAAPTRPTQKTAAIQTTQQPITPTMKAPAAAEKAAPSAKQPSAAPSVENIAPPRVEIPRQAVAPIAAESLPSISGDRSLPSQLLGIR